jgi:1-aminocyclopropane-1-carboxylate deaminase/D-cysteine desulfhydrase-like pyridoxal-dependent ACC family enzyme
MSALPPNALEQRYPDLALPRIALGRFPTPVERLPATVGGAPLWCKREDLSGDRYGGNKVRKLEYLLAASAPVGRPLLSIGADGSHHLLATALFAREVGLETWGVFAPQPPSPHVRANRACLEQILAGWVEVPARPLIPLGVLAVRARLLARRRPQPLGIPAGGSSPTGVVGWVSGGLELAAQVAAGVLPPPQEVWLPFGSGGNAAGLLLGLRLGGLRTRVMAVRVVEWPLVSGLTARWLARRTLALLMRRGLRPPPSLHLGGLFVVEGFLGPGYGAGTPAAERALRRAREEFGLALDTTYTAKALAGCLARDGPPGDPVVFLDTVSATPPPPP